MIKIGSIGSGRRGRLVKLAHRPDEGVVLAAVCDVRPEILNEYRAEFGPDLFVTDDYRQLLARSDLDAIFITSPDYLHEAHALAALRTGRAVYLEKPMAITPEGCDRILRAADAHNAKIYLGHNMRFSPVMRTIKQLIESGRIGNVQAIWCRHFISYGGDAYFRDWHSERRFTTGLLLQKAAHDIDLIHWFANSYVKRVVGMGMLSVYNEGTRRRTALFAGEVKFDEQRWPPLMQSGFSPNIDVEDHSMVMMQLANGIQASYTQCHYTPDSCRNYTIIGTHGRIENVGDNPSDKYPAKIQLRTTRIDRFVEHADEEIPIMPVDGEHGGADPAIIRNFLDYLRTGRNEGTSAWDARMSVVTGYFATLSLRNNNLPYDVPACLVDIA